MAKFPEPPAAGELVAPASREIRALPVGTPLWRLYFRSGRHPTGWGQFRHFGPTSARFDHHLDPPQSQARGILYAALRGPTCIAEVFQESRAIDLGRGEPWLVEFQVADELRLLDLTSSWVTRAGASAAMDSGPRPRARRWSRVIYQACPDIHGLYYRSSMDPQGTAIAVYERARSAMPSSPRTHRALADPALLHAIARVAQDLGYDLIRSR